MSANERAPVDLSGQLEWAPGSQPGTALAPRGQGLPAPEQTGPLVIDRDPLSIVRLALDKNVPVETVQKMVELAEHIADRNARTAFMEALAAFGAECPPILKTRENSQFKVTRSGVQRPARYAALEDIDRTARPIAAKHGLMWTWDTRIEGDLMLVSCRVTHVLGHSEVSTVTMPHGSNAGSSPQQKFGSTQTYGMRYSLIAALGLTTADDDTDGASAKGDGGAVSAEQAADLGALIDEVGGENRVRYRVRFLKWLGAESVETILAADYSRAVAELERLRSEQ